ATISGTNTDRLASLGFAHRTGLPKYRARRLWKAWRRGPSWPGAAIPRRRLDCNTPRQDRRTLAVRPFASVGSQDRKSRPTGPGPSAMRYQELERRRDSVRREKPCSLSSEL